MAGTEPGDSLSEDLRQHLFRVHDDGPRCDVRWVMNQEWMNEVRRLDMRGFLLWHPSPSAEQPQLLLGIPVEVRADGGVPHLESVQAG